MSSIYEVPDLLEPPAAPARPHLRVVPELAPLDFDEVVRRLTPRLQRYATRRLGDRHEAEELVQEALLRAYDHRDELATEDDVAAWSTCVVGRLVIDRLRVRGRSVNVAEVPEGHRVGRDTAEVVVARDEARLALDALDAMPARQAAVLWAREVEGLAYGEIGERFGMTEPAVRSVLSRARKTLRREFATRGGTLPAAGLVALAPWLDGLTWLDRLRRAAARAAAPVVVGVAGMTVLGGVLATPWSTPDDSAPASRPAVSVVQTSVEEQARPTAPAVVTRPTAAAEVPDVRRAVAPAPPADEDALVGDLGLEDACVAMAGASAGGTGCEPQVDGSLHLGPALPDNPTGIDRVGVENRFIDCDALPALPMTECTTPEGDDR